METPFEKISDFVYNTFGQYGILDHRITLNDGSDSTRKAYEVVVTNKTNDSKICTVLRYNEPENRIEMLRGEDFIEVDEKGFAMDMFLSVFLTLNEY